MWIDLIHGFSKIIGFNYIKKPSLKRGGFFLHATWRFHGSSRKIGETNNWWLLSDYLKVWRLEFQKGEGCQGFKVKSNKVIENKEKGAGNKECHRVAGFQGRKVEGVKVELNHFVLYTRYIDLTTRYSWLLTHYETYQLMCLCSGYLILVYWILDAGDWQAFCYLRRIPGTLSVNWRIQDLRLIKFSLFDKDPETSCQ